MNQPLICVMCGGVGQVPVIQSVLLEKDGKTMFRSTMGLERCAGCGGIGRVHSFSTVTATPVERDDG